MILSLLWMELCPTKRYVEILTSSTLNVTSFGIELLQI